MYVYKEGVEEEYEGEFMSHMIVASILEGGASSSLEIPYTMGLDTMTLYPEELFPKSWIEKLNKLILESTNEWYEDLHEVVHENEAAAVQKVVDLIGEPK